MSEDLAKSTLELANGVRLIYPSGWDVKEFSISLERLLSSTALPYKESIRIDLGRSIDGTTSQSFNVSG